MLLNIFHQVLHLVNPVHSLNSIHVCFHCKIFVAQSWFVHSVSLSFIHRERIETCISLITKPIFMIKVYITSQSKWSTFLIPPKYIPHFLQSIIFPVSNPIWFSYEFYIVNLNIPMLNKDEKFLKKTTFTIRQQIYRYQFIIWIKSLLVITFIWLELNFHVFFKLDSENNRIWNLKVHIISRNPYSVLNYLLICFYR